MKLLIKLSALVLLAGFGLTSCLDDDRFDPQHVTYPSELKLGAYATNYTPGNYEYRAVVTENAAGDTILYMIRMGKPESRDSGVVSTLLISDAIAYDDTVGLYTATASNTAFGDDVTATITMAHQSGSQNLTTQVIASGKTNTMVLIPTEEQTVVGIWQSEETEAGFFTCWLFPLDADGKGTGIALFDMDDDAEAVTYERTGAQTYLVSSTESDKKAELSFNSKFQLVASVNDNTFILDPVTSEPVAPEFSFDHPLIGDYTYCGAWFSGPDPDLRLVPVSIDDPYASVFNIEHWGQDVTFRFTWDMVNNQIVVPQQATGSTYDHEGNTYTVYVSDIPSWNSRYTYDDYPCYYDAATATFHFVVIYYIELGYFDLGDETFEVTGDAPEEAVRKKYLTRRVKAQKGVRPDLLLKKPDTPLPRLF